MEKLRTTLCSRNQKWSENRDKLQVTTIFTIATNHTNDSRQYYLLLLFTFILLHSIMYYFQRVKNSMLAVFIYFFAYR